MFQRILGATVIVATLCHLAVADTVVWVDWQSATPGAPGTAAGAGVLPGCRDVVVEYSGDLLAAKTDGGTNWYEGFDQTYTSQSVSNPPSSSDIIRMIGGTRVINTITFSQPVLDPVMAIVSLGQSNLAVHYEFDTPFDVISVGPGYFGNGLLKALPGNVLEGREGNGLVQFVGTLTSISWTVPTPPYD